MGRLEVAIPLVTHVLPSGMVSATAAATADGVGHRLILLLGTQEMLTVGASDLLHKYICLFLLGFWGFGEIGRAHV